MNHVVTRRVALSVCAICALAASGGCPQSQLASLLFFDADPVAPESVEIVDPAPNIAPTVDAGGDLTVSGGQQVILDGFRSGGVGIITYHDISRRCASPSARDRSTLRTPGMIPALLQTRPCRNSFKPERKAPICKVVSRDRRV